MQKLCAQKIEISQVQSIDNVNENKCCDMTCYKITNDTDKDLLTWLSNYPVTNMSSLEIIAAYLKEGCEDECLLDLIINDKLDTNSLKKIGKDFIKNISPKKTFCYLIKTDKQTNLSNRIVIVKREDVKMYMLTHILDEYFYSKDSIVVTPEHILK